MIKTSGPDTATEETADGPGGAAETDEEITGRLLFLVEGRDTHVDAAATNETDGVWINGSQSHRWHVENDSTTLADALASFDVEATSDSLTYENETYEDGANGTTVAYRVDGTVVEDPSAYRLEDADDVHVLVSDSNLTTPGREYSTNHPHAHGSFEATIEDEDLNFSHDRYTMNDDFLHFHGDEDASRWHAHSTNLSLSYAISAFEGFDVTNGSLTYNGTTYDENRTTFTVNDEQVDPETYVIKDGDDIEVVVDETD